MTFLEEGKLEEYEYPDELDTLEEDEDCYINCPECGALVYDDAPQCPECDWYMSTIRGVSPTTSWLVVAMILAILVFSLLR